MCGFFFLTPCYRQITKNLVTGSSVFASDEDAMSCGKEKSLVSALDVNDGLWPSKSYLQWLNDSNKNNNLDDSGSSNNRRHERRRRVGRLKFFVLN